MDTRIIFLISLIFLHAVSSTINVEMHPVHRLLQYQKGTVVYGSRKAAVNFIASTQSEGSLQSKVLLMPIEKATLSDFESVRFWL